MHADRLYAADCDTGSIRVYEQEGDWTQCHDIDLPCAAQHITLSISGGVIYACLSCDNKLMAYSLSGTLQGYWGSYGKGEVGELHAPYLCMTDADGAALIADMFKDRLQVVSARRQWSVVPLQPPVQWPRSALLHRGRLYVASWRSKTLYVYESK